MVDLLLDPSVGMPPLRSLEELEGIYLPNLLFSPLGFPFAELGALAGDNLISAQAHVGGPSDLAPLAVIGYSYPDAHLPKKTSSGGIPSGPAIFLSTDIERVEQRLVSRSGDEFTADATTGNETEDSPWVEFLADDIGPISPFLRDGNSSRTQGALPRTGFDRAGLGKRDGVSTADVRQAHAAFVAASPHAVDSHGQGSS